MNVTWTVSARALYYQLTDKEQAAVDSILWRFHNDVDVPTLRLLSGFKEGDGRSRFYSFRIDNGLSGILKKGENETFYMVDLVRKNQTDALHKLRFE